MISSENSFLIEVIENISDPNLQKEYFKKFLEIQKQSNQKSLENNNNYNLKIVLDKFSSKPKSVQDLRHEISEIKLQINTMLVQKEDLDLGLKVLEEGKNKIEETKDEEQLEEG